MALGTADRNCRLCFEHAHQTLEHWFPPDAAVDLPAIFGGFVDAMHERCAAWDFGKDLKACVRAASPSGRRSRVQEIRIFATTTNALLEAGCLSRLLSAERPNTGWTVVCVRTASRESPAARCVSSSLLEVRPRCRRPRRPGRPRAVRLARVSSHRALER